MSCLDTKLSKYMYVIPSSIAELQFDCDTPAQCVCVYVCHDVMLIVYTSTHVLQLAVVSIATKRHHGA